MGDLKPLDRDPYMGPRLLLTIHKHEDEARKWSHQKRRAAQIRAARAAVTPPA